MKTKLLGTLMIIFGVFLFVGVASASDADVLQPASTITYNEDLTVNGTGRFDSVYIGKQGVGGVTFFNGTIVNSTTGEGGSDNPVTFGDNMRIDGGIFRTEIGPPNAVRILDSVEPGLTLANNLGSPSLEWLNLYAHDADFSGTLTVNKVQGLDDADIPNNITASNYLPLSGGTIAGEVNFNDHVAFKSQSLSGGIPLCGISNYGMTMFSEISISGMGANRLYTCDERGWVIVDNSITGNNVNFSLSLVAEGVYATQVYVPDASVGNVCSASLTTISTHKILISCNMSFSDYADVIFYNKSGSPINLGSGILRVKAWK